MSFYDFAGGFVNTIKGNMDAKAEDERALNMLEKQEKIRMELRQKAEDARVAAKRMFQGGSISEGPQPLMVEEVNSSGRVIGTRPASTGEQDEYVAGRRMEAANLAAGQAKADAALRKEGREERKTEAQIARDKAATSSSYAYAEESKQRTKNLADPKARVDSDDKIQKDIGDMLRYIADYEGDNSEIVREVQETINSGDLELARQKLRIALREKQMGAAAKGKQANSGNDPTKVP